jgi:hypothetical protein
MEKKYFILGAADNSKLVKAIQIFFGIVCLAVAIFWLVFNIRSMKADGTLWITIIFLSGFGLYQIWVGIGKATRFIEISPEKIWLKKTILLPAVEIAAGDIQNMELFPFTLFIFLKTNKKILLRFGTTYPETNEMIKDEVLAFAEQNSIRVEIKEEKI